MRPKMDMSFKVDPEFHRSFKIKAAERGISMTELLRQAYDCYEQMDELEAIRKRR